jgi:hypothetical protein
MAALDQTLFEKRLRERGFTEAEIRVAMEQLLKILGRGEEPNADVMAIYDEYAAFVQRFGLTLDDVTYDDDAVKNEEFDQAYELLLKTMAPYGKNSYENDAAYFIVDDNYGTRELLVEVIDASIDWSSAKAAIARTFADKLPLWSVILRAPGVPDERIGKIDG